MTPTESDVRLPRALTELGAEPVALVLDPAERTYWLFLVSSALIAIVVALGRRGQGLDPQWNPRRWWSRSARLDYALIILKPMVFTVFALPWALSAWGVAMAVVRGLDAWWGVRAIALPWPGAVAAIYSLVLFVAWDLSRYALHRWMHASPFLWELHQVHHSASVLTPFTLYRVHPIESALYRLRGVVVTGTVTGLVFYLFRGDARPLEFLGVNIVGLVFSTLGGNLRHSHVWWSWGRLERWLISPAQHQMHHASAPGATRVNYGTWLAIWDRLGGTLRPAGHEPPLVFGLPRPECNHDPHSVISALVDPLWAMGRGVGGRMWTRIERRRA